MKIFNFLAKPKKRKGKPSERTRVIKALDDLFSIHVRKRDGMCRRCGKVSPIFNHHIFSRKHLSTRWTPENGIALCVSCHRKAHGDPEEFRDWVMLWMGIVNYDTLKMKAFALSAWLTADLKLFLQGIRNGSIRF